MLLARSFSTLVAIVFCFGALAGFDASRAEKSDFFCRSTSHKGSEPDEAAATRLDGDFFVFAEQYTAGPVYMSRGARAFGAPITAWGVATTAFSKDLRGQARPITKFSFSIALTPNAELSIRFTEEQIPRDQWPNFFERLSMTLRSWIRAPDPSTFKWYHEQSRACGSAQ